MSERLTCVSFFMKAIRVVKRPARTQSNERLEAKERTSRPLTPRSELDGRTDTKKKHQGDPLVSVRENRQNFRADFDGRMAQ